MQSTVTAACLNNLLVGRRREFVGVVVTSRCPLAFLWLHPSVYAYINRDTAQGVPCIPSFILILLTGLIELLQFTHTYLIAESKVSESIALFLRFERAEDLLTEVPANLLPLLLTTRSQSQQYRAAAAHPLTAGRFLLSDQCCHVRTRFSGRSNRKLGAEDLNI